MARGKASRNKYTVGDYIEKMKDPRFTFSPKGDWNGVHGDGKSRTNGAFLTKTQATSTEPTVYRVKVMNMVKDTIEIGPIDLEPMPDNEPPKDAYIVNVLREAVGLEPM
ncbi:uncharacterized protein K460DRAFT_351143 [Cucurbitaria berberidis CBS 394.84]|uniref:Uncharacterized protein n=1 Tax=Cucurbitaria berberidis CBS 394.84 TaxID=1168544 RepID=A0A9P4LDU5_9PLEO|nr:uncharacterized protein K460DRAFT_351143 [Cucurbitaria berberidis CBS 394.84]KAF1851183.1 hypothetical protein K460DRAFT_351143 [Cucurbitaria berberidis CBS 394.84]